MRQELRISSLKDPCSLLTVQVCSELLHVSTLPWLCNVSVIIIFLVLGMILVFLDPPNMHNNSICCNSEEIIIVIIIHRHWYVRTFADKINFVHSQGRKQVWVNCHRLIASNPEF